MIDPVEKQTSLANILDEKADVSRETVVEEKPLDIPVLGEEKPVEKPVEKAESRRKKWMDREQEAQGRVRDPETGQFKPKEVKEEKTDKVEETTQVKAEDKKEPVKESQKETKPAAVQQEFTDKEKAFLRAAEEERRKRQILEKEIAEIKSKLPKEPEKTFWDDPEAALKAHEDRIKQEATNARLQMAEFTARQKHPDFDEKIAVFGEVIQKTPGLHQQWLSSPDPAEFAYQVGKNHKDLQEVGSIEEMRAKIERETTARVRAEVEAELKAKAEKLAKEREAIPESLSKARSTGSVNRPVWNGPTPMDDILKG